LERCLLDELFKRTRSIPFERGQEKSVFRFGGSAIAVFGEQGKWRPSEDIVSRTRKGVETLVRLGETIGMRI
jgi:phosphatidylserine decarboxylase